MELHHFESEFRSLLLMRDCQASLEEVRVDIQRCKDEIYADDVAHGESLGDPFCNFTIYDNVAVFTFFENEFSVYVLLCNQAELIQLMEPLAMIQTEECKSLLGERFGKHTPDLQIPRAVAELWLS